MRKVRLGALAVLLALLLSSIVRLFLFETYLVPSESMVPTLQVDERIAVSKFAAIKRGDIIVFRDPANWLPGEAVTPPPLQLTLSRIGILPTFTGQDLVKRVVGVGGDKVECCDSEGRLTVNGTPVDESSYVDPSGGTDKIQFEVTVPKGKFFVMGDNRDTSADSRSHLFDQDLDEQDEQSLVDPTTGGIKISDDAFVSADDVVGKVLAVLWPSSDARRVTKSSAVLHFLDDKK